MKKVGIVTSHTSFRNNYGAVLQCYALSEQLKRWGYLPYVINYTYMNENKRMEIENANKYSLKERINYVFSGEIDLLTKFSYRAKRKKRIKMEESFIDFYKRYLNIIPEEPITYEELKENPLGFDIYITGSDQVWNPKIHGNKNDEICFLSFAEKEAIKIAYAPSFGINNYPPNLYTDLMSKLKGLDAISVRECQGQKIILDACNMEVPVVLDPTLMADPDIFQPISNQKLNLPSEYILCYRFGKMSYSAEIIKKIAEQLNLPVVELPLSIEAYRKGTMLCYDVDPSRFITAIKNATLILTDSFHCTVFSILNHKPFFTFLRQSPDEKNNMNGRMIELLNGLGLENRLLYPEIDFKRLQEEDLNIRYENTDLILQKERMRSQNFLKSVLKDN